MKSQESDNRPIQTENREYRNRRKQRDGRECTKSIVEYDRSIEAQYDRSEQCRRNGKEVR